MTQEEKARRYDEALERARKCLDEKRDTCFVRPDVIFPELRESEDERIRKVLIDLVKCNERSGYTLLNNVTTDSMLAWLEKQSKQNSIEQWRPKFKVGDIIIKSRNSDINKFGKFKITDIKNGRYWYNEFVICEISEQDEWELVGIEPKFHEGD